MWNWNLDDEEKYFKLLKAKIPHAYTWASSAGDKQKREDIRRVLDEVFPDTDSIPRARWWAFRIFVEKHDNTWDVDNLPKLVVDALSGWQIKKDNSDFPNVALYEDDTVDLVRMVQVAGEQSKHQDRTVIEVFGAI